MISRPAPRVTIAGSLREARNRLAGTSATASLDAHRLLEHVTGHDRAWMLAHGDAPLDEPALGAFEALVVERARGTPIPYLTGEAWFYGRAFEVTPDVLVPRPETELLVERVLAFLRRSLARRERSLRVDVGRSGIIAVRRALPNLDITAIETSEEALAIAKRNCTASRRRD